MQFAHNISMPETLAELVDSKRTALLFYDMQLWPQLLDGPKAAPWSPQNNDNEREHNDD